MITSVIWLTHEEYIWRIRSSSQLALESVTVADDRGLGIEGNDGTLECPFGSWDSILELSEVQGLPRDEA